jgi:hypothetical protein
MKTMKIIATIGAAMTVVRVIKTVTNLDSDGMLHFVGLERRRSHGWEKLAFFGFGALAGAGAGLLLAPASGRETRAKLGERVDQLATQATEALAEARGEQQAPRITGQGSVQHRNAGNQGTS